MTDPDFTNPYERIWKTRDLRALDTPLELENNTSQFRRGLNAFGKEMQATGYGLAALGAQGLENVIGENPVTSGITDWGIEGYKQAIDESQSGYNAPNVADIEKIKSVGDFTDWASYQLGKGLPMLGTLALSGGVGGAIGRLTAQEGVKQIAKGAVGSAVKKGVETKALQAAEGQIITKAMQETAAKALRDRVVTGAMAGGFAGSFGLEGGLAFGEQVEAGVAPQDAVKSAVAVGGINGALEFLPFYGVAKSIGLGQYAKQSIKNIIETNPELSKRAIELAKEVAGRAGKGGAIGAGAEGITEGLQELTSIAGLRWAKQDPLFAELSDEDWNRIGNAMATGALVGGTAAGAGATLKGPEVTDNVSTGNIAPTTVRTREQEIEAALTKLTSNLETAKASGDTKAIQELQQIKEMYNAALGKPTIEPVSETLSNEQVQPITEEQPTPDAIQAQTQPSLEIPAGPEGTGRVREEGTEAKTGLEVGEVIQPRSGESIQLKRGEEIVLTSDGARVRTTLMPEEVEALRRRMGPRPERKSIQPVEKMANAQEVQAQTEAEVKGTPPLYSKPIGEIKSPNEEAATEATMEEFEAVRRQFQERQTQTPFKKWFGTGTPGVTATREGEPITLYHGTNNPAFFEWDSTKAGEASGHPTSGLGFFMTADQGAAARYGNNLLALHAKINNPYTLTDADLTRIETAQDAAQLRKRLMNKGYDGAIVTAPGASPYVIAFQANQIKLKSNTAPTDSPDMRYSKPLQGREASAPFYSALERATQGIKQQKAPASQWLGMLDTMVKKGIIRQEELDWNGTKEWLQEQKGPVTKEALLQHVKDNTLEVQETSLTDNPDIYALGEWIRARNADPNSKTEVLDWKWKGESKPSVTLVKVGENDWHTSLSPERGTLDEVKQEAEDHLKFVARDKFEPRNTNWTAPGGKNQRELVLTVPSVEPFNTDDTTHYGDVEGGKAVAWVRFNDRTDEDGKKTLFVEEIQSKRHQEGKEKGYIEKDLIPLNELRIEKTLKDKGWHFYDKDNHWVHFVSEYDAATEEEALKVAEQDFKKDTRIIDRSLRFNVNDKRVPNAPFKQTIAGSGQTLSGWAGLAFKRMLRYAVENGYDKVAWTTGEQQAKRYNLAQSVSKVAYTSDGYFQAYDRNGRVVMSSLMDENEVPNYIGKELTNELLAAPVKGGERTVELAEDKVIGGEGMKGFYNRLLPNEINKYIKKWNTKVDKTQIKFGDESASVHSVEITPAMRDSVMQGQPLFSKPQESTSEFKKWSREYPVIDSASPAGNNTFKSGKPFVAKVYHGSRSNVIEEFDSSKLGSFTKAPSARKGFFFAGDAKTALAYAASEPVDIKKIKLEFDGVPYSSATLTDGKPKETALAILHMKADRDFGQATRDITDTDKNLLIDETIAELKNAQEEDNLFAAEYPDSVFASDKIHGEAAEWLEQNRDGIVLESELVKPIRPTIYPVYVRMSNPMVHDQNGEEYREVTYSDLIDLAKEKGHDGLVILNTYDGGALDNIFVAFDNKSVKGYYNKGTYDETERLLYSSTQQSAAKTTAQDLRSNIDSVMGEGWAKQAEALNLIEIIEGAGPQGESGSWVEGKIRLYTDTMPANSSPVGVLLHEGEHHTFAELLGKSLPEYVKDLHTLAANGHVIANNAMLHAAIVTADLLGIKHNLRGKITKADFNAVRALIEQERPGLLAEEELAYFVQYGADAQTGTGFWKRLVNQIKAWFAQTKLGQRLKEMGIGFELTDGMAVEWAKAGLHMSLTKLQQAEQIRAKVGLVPASVRVGQVLENLPDPFYSIGIQEIKQQLWNDPTDARPEIVNKPGLLQKWRADFVDFFAEMEKKSKEIYDTYSLLRSKKAARIEQARQEYFLPLRKLIAESPWTAEEVGDMLAARHIKVDKVNLQLARRASYQYTKELLKGLPKAEQKKLMRARVNVKAGKMPDGSVYIDANGNPAQMSANTKQQLMFDLMNKYSQFEIANTEGVQVLREEWEIFKDAAAGFSNGGVGSARVRVVDDILKLVDRNRAKFDKITTIFDAANRHMLELLEDGGLITTAEHARLLADKSAYAPLRRESYNVDEETAQLFRRAGYGGSKQLTTRSGTENLSEPTLVLQNALAAIEAAAAAAERNLANKELYKVIVKDQAGWKSWFTIVDEEKYVTHDEDGFLQEKNATGSNRADVVLINNGKKLVIRPNMHNERAMGFVRAINNLDVQVFSGPMRVLGWLNQIVRWVNVSASPVFLMMNAFRDPFTALYNLQATEAEKYTKEIFSPQTYKDSFKALKKVFMDGNRDPTDPDVQLVEKWELAGGRTSFVEALREMDSTWKSFNSQVARRQGTVFGLNMPGFKTLMDAKDKWIEGIENFNILFENVMRFSTFKVLMEKGGVSEARAARISQDLTTNFTRRGYKTQALGTWWLFFNASVQGNYQVVRNLMSSRKVQTAVGGTIVMALLLDLLGRAVADDWDEIPEWDKERFIIFPLKVAGDFVRIPAPWVYNVAWRTGGLLGEMLSQVKTPQDGLLDIAAMTMTTFNPLGKPGSLAQAISPTGFDPFMQILENKNFAGNPIGPEGFPGASKKANSELIWNNTPKGYQSIARFVNEATGGSAVESGAIDLKPGDYQILVNFLTGSLGRFMADATFGVKEALDKDFEGMRDIPIVKEFFSDPYDPLKSQKYHTNVAGIYGAHKLEQLYSKGPDRDLIKLQEVRKNRGKELQMYSQAQDVERQLKSLRVRLRVAQNRGDAAKEKELRDRIGKIQERFNNVYQQKMG